MSEHVYSCRVQRVKYKGVSYLVAYEDDGDNCGYDGNNCGYDVTLEDTGDAVRDDDLREELIELVEG